MQAVIIALAFLTLIGISWMLNKTFLGKEIRAINQSPALAHLIGINTNRVIMIVSIVVGAVLGAYGLCVGFDTGMEPTMGFNVLFMYDGAIIGTLYLAGYLGSILALAEILVAFASQCVM